MNELRNVPVPRIDGPAQLLQAVPYLLGFHPTESLVLVGLAARRLVVTARLDLADLGEPELLGDTVGAMVRGGTEVVIGAIYDGGPPAHPLPWRGLVGYLSEECERHDCDLGDLLLVSGERWWSYLCDSPACCPPEGSPLDDVPSAFVAEATFAGIGPLPDRRALAATLDPVAAPRLAAVGRLLEQAASGQPAAGPEARSLLSVKRAIFAAARRADAAEAAADRTAVDRAAEDRTDWPPDGDVARFGHALTAIAVRDAVWIAVDQGRLDGRALWRELGRRLPGRYAAAPLFLLGWASWRAGNGALAGLAAEAALARDPGCHPADMLLAVLSYGLSPKQVPRLRSRPAA